MKLRKATERKLKVDEDRLEIKKDKIERQQKIIKKSLIRLSCRAKKDPWAQKFVYRFFICNIHNSHANINYTLYILAQMKTNDQVYN